MEYLVSELGKKSEYESHYNPNKLFPIPRKIKRDEIGVSMPLPFFGYDTWNHYEVSWLNKKGKPQPTKTLATCNSNIKIRSTLNKLRQSRNARGRQNRGS